MELTLLRTKLREELTNGQLYIDGNFFCFTLEDKVREVVGKPVSDWKVQNATAIPVGVYDMVLENSPRFGIATLTLKDVPGFTKIRIHSGNSPTDTEGCIIVGYRLSATGIIIPGTTRTCLADLKKLVTMPCIIRITNPLN